MKKQRLLMCFIAVLAVLGGYGFAQADAPAAYLEYYDFGVSVFDSEGFEIPDISFGFELDPGYRIETNEGAAEISLQPNGSIIKLSPGTNFTIDSVQGRDGSTSNNFSVGRGRIRAVAAKVTGSEYNFRTRTAVGGVRGTDFGIEVVPDQSDSLFVAEGSVEFTNSETGESLLLGAGQFANALSEVFQAVNLTAEEMGALFEGLDFSALDPASVPGQPQPQADDQPADQPEEGDDGSETASGAGSSGPLASPESQQDQTAQEEGEAQGDPTINTDSPIYKFLSDFLGMEVGSITMDGKTYGKAVFQPKINFGSFRSQLYLPIIYSDNLLDPENWHKPQGNDEWSFGTDQPEGEVLAIVGDVLKDLVLKIKYIEIGDYRDPFFLKLGNVESMTLGHGMLINNYANDADFPAVRRMGLNIGLTGKKVGLELLTNDLSNPEIFGTRFVFRPAAPSFGLGVALSLAADINPGGELERAAESAGTDNLTELQKAAAEADLMFFNAAFDIDVPIVETDFLSLVLFGDLGTFIPYVGSSVTLDGTTIESGLRTEAFIERDDGLKIRNYGIQTGLFGNLWILDYRLEFQYYQGAFTPSFYNNPYDRIRSQRATDTLTFLLDPAGFDGITKAGVYGSAGAQIIPGLSLGAGYKWPWVIGAEGEADITADDYFHIGLHVAEGLLPYNISGGIQFERARFRDVFTDTENFSLFDENATFKGSISVEVAPLMDIVLSVGTAVLRDDTGAVRYNEGGKPVFGPTISLETKIGF
ncbi:FecR family protein [Spirochaeta lutea]|uniref:FecR protein domain-containing protein n=1 Tax=Spirochaeta lutea TaxID=1480694 RepID=A0A098QUJ4_9SPIO|nr:FecR domain-containing protein [Spirochaeta lutea]KGE71349.1 hypothetical protein DC28_11090 [Spirochaeta lutea]